MIKIQFVFDTKILRELVVRPNSPEAIVPEKRDTIIINEEKYGVLNKVWNFDALEPNIFSNGSALKIVVNLYRKF